MAKEKVDTNKLQDLVKRYVGTLQTSECADIITFTQAKWGLNFKLSPVQEFILRVYYGLPLDETEENIRVPDDTGTKTIGMFTQRAFMDYLIEEGLINLTTYVAGHQYKELILCLGRRSGKSVLSSIISTYETYKLVKMGNPQEHFKFPSGQQISVTLVSTTEEQAQTMFDMVRTRGADCQYLKDRIMHTTQTYFDVITDDDREKERPKGSVKLQCGGSSSAALRGSNNIVVIFDEAAFFQGGDGRSSGSEVYKALTPSILTFGSEGKILLLSSPNGKSGLFYEKYRESFDDTDRILMFQLPSALANPLVDSSFLRSEKRRDKKSFDCEYGAKFMDTLSAWVDDLPEFNKCIDNTLEINNKRGNKDFQYHWGIDVGLKNDGTAITICHKENEKIVIDYSNVWFSGSSDVWDSVNKLYSENTEKLFAGYDTIPLEGVVDLIDKLALKYPPFHGWFDQFNGQALHEMLLNKGYRQFDMIGVSAGINMKTFQTCKNLYTGNLLKLPNHPILIPELLTLEETRSGVNFKVEAPQRQGYHDDISVSLMRAVWDCYESKDRKYNTNAQTIKMGLNNSTSYYQYHMKKAKMIGVEERRMTGRMSLLGLKRF
jgi:hypothetical protein